MNDVKIFNKEILCIIRIVSASRMLADFDVLTFFRGSDLCVNNEYTQEVM